MRGPSSPQSAGDEMIVEKDFSLDKALMELKSEDVGAISFFIGSVRESPRKLEYLRFDFYEEMVEKKFSEIRNETEKRFDVKKVLILHRVGKLKVGENIMLVAVSSPHRKEAFKALKFAVEEIKKIVPIWKKEVFRDEEVWV
ncbi:MAG: molybdenum cofactor biosynthesis protein MoaE [Candidatus Methanofastidiosia archaeon]